MPREYTVEDSFGREITFDWDEDRDPTDDDFELVFSSIAEPTKPTITTEPTAQPEMFGGTVKPPTMVDDASPLVEGMERSQPPETITPQSQEQEDFSIMGSFKKGAKELAANITEFGQTFMEFA